MSNEMMTVLNKLAEWNSVCEQLPPENVIVETKIDDGKCCRNQTKLRRIHNLWFLPDKSIYVYYTPTHWRYI